MVAGDATDAVALGELLRQEVTRALGDPVTSCAAWSTLAAIGYSGRDEIRPIEVSFARSGQTAPFLIYYLVPWQPLYAARRDDRPMIGPQLVTVTEPALIFTTAGGDSGVPPILLAATRRTADVALEVTANQAEVAGDLATPLPEGLRLIRARRHRHYLELEVAVPGTSVVEDAALQGLAPSKMVRLLMVPDIGAVTERWLAPAPLAAGGPPNKDQTTTPPEPAPPGGDPSPPAEPGPGGRDLVFPDYTPKLGRDTVLDYRGALHDAVARLPAADLDHLGALIRTLADQQRLAAKHPGSWRDGNQILGADAKEYDPSDAELLVSELGDRVAAVVAAAPPADLAAVLGRAKIAAREVTYGAIAIRHTDVMGSGRFFYASAPQPTTIVLRH